MEGADRLNPGPCSRAFEIPISVRDNPDICAGQSRHPARDHVPDPGAHVTRSGSPEIWISDLDSDLEIDDDDRAASRETLLWTCLGFEVHRRTSSRAGRARGYVPLAVGVITAAVTFAALIMTGGDELVSDFVDAVRVSASESVRR